MPVIMKRRRIPKRYSKNTTFRIKRVVVGQAMTGPTVSGSAARYVYTYKLSDIASAMRFETMYDKYRLAGIKVKFYPPVSDLTDATKDPGYFYYRVDTDDSSVPIFEDLVNSNQTRKRKLVGKPFTVFFRPKYASGAYEGTSIYPAVQASGREWLDTAYIGIQHYSLKTAWISYASLTNVMTYDVTYYVEFKDLKEMNG